MDKVNVTEIGGETPTDGANKVIDFLAPYRVEFTLEGNSDFLFHRWNCEAVDAKANAAKGSKAKKCDDIESYVYRLDNNNLGIPGEYVRQAVVNAAKYRQDPRSPRKSAMDLFKAGVVNLTPLADLGKPTWDYEDRRRVVIQKSGINRTRPALKSGWKVTFIFMINLPQYIESSVFHEVLINAGRLIGIGDFRPTYGRFNVTNFIILKD